MAAFTGQLRSNEIFAALYNMIISQEVFADNIKGTDLVDEARVEGGLYGDTKLFYSTDALASAEWGNDAEAVNLLDIARPEAPKCQAIVLDKFRQISLTVDDYLSKRAWGSEGAFSSFNAVMLGWLRDTKKVYDGTTYNCYIGTVEGASAKAEIEVRASDATTLAEDLANVITEMTDYTRDFNDYAQLRRYSEDEIKIVFNSKYINRIKNVDLPVIFDNAGLKATFAKKVLPARYFGTVNSSIKVADAKTRSLIEQTIDGKHYFAGDIIELGDSAPAGTSYQEDDTIVAKVLVKLPPYMSAFETGTSFFNAKSLTENHYLTFRTQYNRIFKSISNGHIESKRIVYIYCHKNLTNGKVYIGQTVDPTRRFRLNGYDYRKSPKFWNAIKKYGWDNFSHEIIDICDIEDADELEKAYINLYNSFNKGYNANEGGNGNKGHIIKNKQNLGRYKHSDEHNKNTSKTCLERHINAKYKIKYDNKEFIGISELARYLGEQPRTVYRWVKNGRLNCVYSQLI